MIGQNLGANVHLSQPGPRQYNTACKDDDQPEGDGSAQRMSQRGCRGFKVLRQQDRVHPNDSSGEPASELMKEVRTHSVVPTIESLLDGSAQRYYAS